MSISQINEITIDIIQEIIETGRNKIEARSGREIENKKF